MLNRIIFRVGYILSRGINLLYIKKTLANITQTTNCLLDVPNNDNRSQYLNYV